MSSNEGVESLRTILGKIPRLLTKRPTSQIDPWKTWAMHRDVISCQSKVLDYVSIAWNSREKSIGGVYIDTKPIKRRLYTCQVVSEL